MLYYNTIMSEKDELELQSRLDEAIALADQGGVGLGTKQRRIAKVVNLENMMKDLKRSQRWPGTFGAAVGPLGPVYHDRGHPPGADAIGGSGGKSKRKSIRKSIRKSEGGGEEEDINYIARQNAEHRVAQMNAKYDAIEAAKQKRLQRRELQRKKRRYDRNYLSEYIDSEHLVDGGSKRRRIKSVKRKSTKRKSTKRSKFLKRKSIKRKSTRNKLSKRRR
jgi:hypothetical protein